MPVSSDSEEIVDAMLQSMPVKAKQDNPVSQVAQARMFSQHLSQIVSI